MGLGVHLWQELKLSVTREQFLELGCQAMEEGTGNVDGVWLSAIQRANRVEIVIEVLIDRALDHCTSLLVISALLACHHFVLGTNLPLFPKEGLFQSVGHDVICRLVHMFAKLPFKQVVIQFHVGAMVIAVQDAKSRVLIMLQGLDGSESLLGIHQYLLSQLLMNHVCSLT